MSFLFDLLGKHTSLSVVAIAAAVWAAWKYKRLQAWATVLIGGVSTAAFVGMTLVLGGLGAVAAGWLDPATVVSDLAGWGSAAWNMVGDTVLELLTGVLPE